MDHQTGIIILAAGNSSRLGKPKQLLAYKGQNLLQHACNAALGSAAAPVIVVLGAGAEAISREIDPSHVDIVVNTDWQTGISSSIRCGLTRLLEISSHSPAVILMLCDQPYLEQRILDQLLSLKAKSGKGIIACSYGETIGTPVLFDEYYYPQLMKLKGQEGAKKLLFDHSKDVMTVSFPDGITDIDTPSDYEALK